MSRVSDEAARRKAGEGSGLTPARLRRRADFLAAAEGRRFHTENLTAQGRARAVVPGDAAGLRLGFTITKRVGHATERNRIRRRLREAVRAVAGDLPVMDADVVVIARRPALGAAFETLKDDLRRATASALRPRAPDADGKDLLRGPRRGKGGGRGAKRGDTAASGGPIPTTSPVSRDARPDTRTASIPDTNACDGTSDGQ